MRGQKARGGPAQARGAAAWRRSEGWDTRLRRGSGMSQLGAHAPSGGPGDDMARMIEAAAAAESEIDEKLAALLNSSDRIPSSIREMAHDVADLLSSLIRDSAKLTSAVEDASARAERVSARVRRLDTAQQRSEQLLMMIRAVRTRENVVDGVRTALAVGNLPAAVENVRAYLQVERRHIAGSDELSAPQLADVSEARKDVEAALRHRLSQAVRSRDHAAVLATLPMMRAVGIAAEGSAAFTTYVQDLVRNRVRDDYEALVEAVEDPALGKHADFAGCLTELFRDIGVAIEQNEASLISGLGPGALEATALALFRLADEWATRVLRLFMRAKGVADASSRASSQGTTQRPGVPDKSGEGLIQEVLSLCSQGEEFVRYVLSKAERARKLTQDRGAKAGANPEPRGQPAQSRASSRDLASADSGRLGRRTSAVGDGRGAVSRQSSARGLAGQGDGGGAGAVDEDNDCLGLPSTVPEEQASSTVRSGPFCSIVRELLGHYVGLEEYYMESAVQTAIAIDEPTAGGLTTSFVDDAFFVLLRCCQRAIATASLQPVCAVVTHANALVSGAVRQAIAGQLAGGAQRISLNLPGAVQLLSVAESQAEAERHARAMNNAHVAAGYVTSLQQSLRRDSARVFPTQADADRLDLVLSDMSKTASDMLQLRNKAVENLVQALRPRMQEALDEFGGTKYDAEAAPEAASRVSPWVGTLLNELERLSGHLAPLLSEDVLASVAQSLVGSSAAAIEQLLRRKRVSQLGALQLEMDVRALTQGTSALAPRSVRETLARLTQTAAVLSCESPRELLELWGPGPGGSAGGANTWRLSWEEAKRILGQRIEFSAAEVAAMELGS